MTVYFGIWSGNQLIFALKYALPILAKSLEEKAMAEINVNTIIDNMNMLEKAAIEKQTVEKKDYGFWENETLVCQLKKVM